MRQREKEIVSERITAITITAINTTIAAFTAVSAAIIAIGATVAAIAAFSPLPSSPPNLLITRRVVLSVYIGGWGV